MPFVDFQWCGLIEKIHLQTVKEEDFCFSCAGFPQAHGTMGNARFQTYCLIVVVTEFTILPSHSALHFFFPTGSFSSLQIRPGSFHLEISSFDPDASSSYYPDLLSFIINKILNRVIWIYHLHLLPTNCSFIPHVLASFLTTPLQLHSWIILASQSHFFSFLVTSGSIATVIHLKKKEKPLFSDLFGALPVSDVK